MWHALTVKDAEDVVNRKNETPDTGNIVCSYEMNYFLLGM